ADAFDAMLARLEAHVAEQQRFAANASHELRTPLAIAQTLLDVARNDQNRDNDELVDRLHAVNTRAIDLTEALLLLSRADQRSFTREHVDLSLIAEEATEPLFPLAEKRGLTARYGTLSLTPRTAGGIRVTRQLPAAPPPNGRRRSGEPDSSAGSASEPFPLAAEFIRPADVRGCRSTRASRAPDS